MRVLISACLLGVACRYDGKSRACPEAVRLLENYELIPVCPEQLGGLPTPRPPAEIQKNGRVISRTGEDVTAAYRKGAEETLGLCRLTGCRAAVLKANSPSCGCGQVYDGSFSGVLVPGSGITAQLLKDHGVRVLTEEDLLSSGGAVF
ncbi:MAG: DUF523 domain-containing protein [Clostridiales bacterium]|nr:DUF523 domain-containing protein [Clostridiales bacterium]